MAKNKVKTFYRLTKKKVEFEDLKSGDMFSIDHDEFVSHNITFVVTDSTLVGDGKVTAKTIGHLDKKMDSKATVRTK